MFCTHCGSRLPEGAAFCPTCGREAHRGPSCPNCTYRLPVGAVFCARCGRGVTPAPGSVGVVPEGAPPTDGAGAPSGAGGGYDDHRPGTVTGERADETPPGSVAPPRVPAPAAGERVLPSNVASWAAPEANPRRHVPSASSVGTGSGLGTERYPPPSLGWSYGPPPAGTPLQAVIEPTIGGVYGHAWATVRERFWGLLFVGLVATIIGGLMSLAINSVGALIDSAIDAQVFTVVAQLLAQVLGTWPIWAGVQYANLQTVRSGRAEIDDIFAGYRRGLVNLIVAQFVTTVLIVVSFALLIVPGIVVGLRLSFVTLLVVDEGFGPIEAIAESWRRSSGFGWTLLGIGMVAIPVLAVGFLSLIVGLIPAAMVVALTTPTMFAAATAVKGQRLPGY